MNATKPWEWMVLNKKTLGAGLVCAVMTFGSVAFAAETTTTTGEAGANSFTEGQAKSRIEDAGYTGVTGLKKDDKGIWRGTAMKNGQSSPVGLDFKGNVVTQ